MHKEPFATLTFNERKHGKNSIFLSAVTSENRCNQRFKLFERNLQKKNYCRGYGATESHLGSVLDDVHDVRVPDNKHSTKRGLISLMTKHELTCDRVAS